MASSRVERWFFLTTEASARRPAGLRPRNPGGRAVDRAAVPT